MSLLMIISKTLSTVHTENGIHRVEYSRITANKSLILGAFRA